MNAYAFVMAGLVPAIHVLSFRTAIKSWMPGTRPGMTMQSSPHQWRSKRLQKTLRIDVNVELDRTVLLRRGV